MQKVQPLPNYTDLAEALQAMDSTFTPAEMHGLLCGLLCANPIDTHSEWEKIALGPKKIKATKLLLQELYATSQFQMNQFSFEFQLSLPDDESPINSRVEALRLWCEGFLTGLKQADPAVEDGASAEILDALHDITEIAQVNFEEVDASEEDETAYFELVEYVRLVALMIYHERSQKPGSSYPDSSDALH